MAWDDPLGDLRRLLNDTDVSNLVKEKRVFGTTNGLNRIFYTFDDRLVASGNQSVCARPLRLWYDDGFTGGIEMASSGITITDQYRGEFQTTLLLSGTYRVTASYYYQQSTDSELNFALTQGVNLVNGSNVSQIDPGLQLAVLYYAAAIVNRRLAQRWQQRKSEQFMLEDEPMRKEAEDRIQFHLKQAEIGGKEAQSLRQQFYDMRMDRGRAPAYKLLARTPRPYTPRR